MTTDLRRVVQAASVTALPLVLVSALLSGQALAQQSSSHRDVSLSGTLTLVSTNDADEPLAGRSRIPYARPVASHNGRFVVFQSLDDTLASVDNDHQEDVFVRDTVDGTSTLVSGVGGTAYGGGGGTISASGRYIAFLSESRITTDDHNDEFDLYVFDMKTSALTLASVTSNGRQRHRDIDDAVISGNGKRVAFLTSAKFTPSDDDPAGIQDWLTQDVYEHSLFTGRTRLVSVNGHGSNFAEPVGLGGISYDGRKVGFSWGSPGKNAHRAPRGFYVRNMKASGSRLIWRQDLRVTSIETESSPALSGNGRYAAFASKSPALDPDPDFQKYDVARYDLRAGKLRLLTVGLRGRDARGDSWAPTLSRDGKFISFASNARNLVPGHDVHGTDAFRVNCRKGVIKLVSGGSGGPGDQESAIGGGVAISEDGLHVAFHSNAGNFVPNDENMVSDVFLWTAER